MDPIVVVGSGASGVHFALSALEQGRRVLMLDVGRPRPDHELPAESFEGLKARHPDPVRYFLGADYEAVVLPGRRGEYYGFPPNREYVFAGADEFEHRSEGFAPLVSFAAGGLAEAWTGGCYPFHDVELRDFPFGYQELEPYYVLVARRIGIAGTEDDLARFLPLHDGLLEPLELDEGSRVFLEAYRRRRGDLNARHGFYAGRARIATLSREHAGRRPCSYLGRCLWGCPTDALYTPSVTLRECRSFPDFTYIQNHVVDHFVTDSGGRVRRVVARVLPGGAPRTFEAGALVLAAGTLSSCRIFLESIYRDTGRLVELPGLMDNRQILMPFVNIGLVGRAPRLRSYQYNQVALGLDRGGAEGYVHCLVTTLKSALVHPIIQRIPGPLRFASGLFRELHGAFGLVNVNFADQRRPENHLRLERGAGRDRSRLVVTYHPSVDEPARMRQATQALRGVLRKLGCIAPASMAHVRPMGASVHYAGTVPMTTDNAAGWTADPFGRSRQFPNLIFADGTTFPFLPAKNLTFTLMANAARLAEQAL